MLSSNNIDISYGNLDFPDGSDGKESACNTVDLCSIPGLGRSPGGGHGNPLQYSCLEKPHGESILAGNSPWDCKELDTTERLSTTCSTGQLYTIFFHYYPLQKKVFCWMFRFLNHFLCWNRNATNLLFMWFM